MLDDFSVLKRPFRTCPSKTTSYLRAFLFHQFTWTFLVAFLNDALSFLHHIFVRTPFIGTGAIPFNIYPLRCGWHFPRGIWKFFQRGPGGGGAESATFDLKRNFRRGMRKPYGDKRWKTYRSSRASTLPLSPLSPPVQILLADRAFECITLR